MPGEVSEGFLTKLTDRRARVYEAAERLLIEARSQGRQILNEGEDRRYRQAQSDLTALDEQIAEYREDLERSGIPAHLSRLSPTNPQTTSRNTMKPSQRTRGDFPGQGGHLGKPAVQLRGTQDRCLPVVGWFRRDVLPGHESILARRNPDARRRGTGS